MQFPVFFVTGLFSLVIEVASRRAAFHTNPVVLIRILVYYNQSYQSFHTGMRTPMSTQTFLNMYQCQHVVGILKNKNPVCRAVHVQKKTE